jgi:phage-related protein
MAGPLDRAFVEIIPDFDNFNRETRRGVDTASKDIERGLSRGLAKAEKQAGRDGNRIGSTTGSSFAEGLESTLSSIAGIKLPVAGFTVLSGAIGAAAASAIQFAAALAPAAGIVAALPSGIGVLAAGMTTLNVATLGVADAFEVAATGSAEEFSDAMEGLAPSVQSAAQAIRDLMPELEELRNSVQGAFFQDFDDVLNSLAETLLGPVSTGMTAVATEINGIIVGLAGVATSAEGVDFVTQSFSIMAGIIAAVQEPLILLFSSLLNVGTAINEAFGADTGAGLAGLIVQFADFLDKAASSGQAVQWINDAMKTFTALGNILSPIVGIIASIGTAARTTGGNILGVFGQALQVFDDFLASAQGQEVLISIFEALNQVGAAFATILGNIAPAIGPLVSGLSSIFAAVAPLLGPLSELVGSVLTALAPILLVIASAIEPLIAPLTTIVTILGEILVSALDAVMPLIQLLADLLGTSLGVVLEVVAVALSAIAPILTVLFEALGPVIEALTPLFEILGLVADIIGTVLAPIIQVLGDILLWVVDNVIVPILVPAIQGLAEILSVLLTAAIQFLVDYFQSAWEGLGVLFTWLKDNLLDNAEQMIAGWQFLTAAFRAGKDFLERNVFTPIKNGIGFVKNTILNNLGSIQSGWNSFISFVRGIPDKISGALSRMFSPLATGFKSAINSVIRGWNNLSFSIPSVDLGPLGSVGGFTVSTPNIPYLAQGALATGPTLAMVGEGRFNEAILPLGDPRVDNLLASAMGRAGVANQGNAGTGGETINATGMNGDNFFVVKIGERELTDIVVERQNDMNQDTLRRARAGTGRRF